MKSNEKILLGHGSGGRLSHELIDQLFAKYFDNPFLRRQYDSALLQVDAGNIAYTTDSFVVDPIFFPGGNIGKLAIAGTVNDLAVSGAKPLYLSCGFIIEEGFPFSELEEIVRTMAEEAEKAGTLIVTGDTKVVDKGKCDKVFINTSGIGVLDEKYREISSGSGIRPGVRIIINGTIGDHGMAVMAARNDLKISARIRSDCACLNGMIHEVLLTSDRVRFMRDATRGGLGTVLSEIARNRAFGIHIEEEALSITPEVRGMCELLGFDPIHVANEGKVVVVVAEEDAGDVVKTMKKHPFGINASVIGRVTDEHHGMAWMQTIVGGRRIIEMLSGQQLPRIC